MIDSQTIDRIYAAADIVEIVNDFTPLKKKGVNYQACCPFHNEKTPSFVVSPSKGLYKCFGCGEGGNVINFVMKHESMSYVEALKYVAKRYGIEVKESELSPERKKELDEKESMLSLNIFAQGYFSEQLTATSEGRNIALTYFRERGFSDQTIQKFGLGYCPDSGSSFSNAAINAHFKEEFMVSTGLTVINNGGGYWDRFTGRVIFPITSFTGRVIGFGGRTMRSDKKVAKYLNSPESAIYHKSDTLYGISQSKKAISAQDKAILVEGYTDVISLHQAGVENVVASSGTSLTKGQVQLVKRLTHNVTVIYDGDAAGIKASLRGIDIILAEGVNVRVVLMPEGEDPDSFARSHTAEELTQYIDKNEVDFLTFKSNLLISEVKDDPIGRAQVISDVVDSIAVIEDNIARSQFITQCAKLLEVDIEVISNETNTRRAKLIGGKAAADVEKNRAKRDHYQKRQLETVAEKDIVTDTLHCLERELLEYIVLHGDNKIFVLEDGMEEPLEIGVAELIFSELEIDSIDFSLKENHEIATIYKSLLAKAIESKSGVDLTPLINHSSPAVSSLIADIIFKKDFYVPSKIWSKLDSVIIDVEHSLDRAIPKAIAIYKQKVVDKMIDEMKKSISAASSNEESLEILKNIHSLEQAKKVICEKYQRFR
ncbi:MAG: DNA primase [Rikenellaceae bacterium]